MDWEASFIGVSLQLTCSNTAGSLPRPSTTDSQAQDEFPSGPFRNLCWSKLMGLNFLGLSLFKDFFKIHFLKFGIISDFQKNCKDSTESSHIHLSRFPLKIASYITAGHLSKWRSQRFSEILFWFYPIYLLILFLVAGWKPGHHIAFSCQGSPVSSGLWQLLVLSYFTSPWQFRGIPFSFRLWKWPSMWVCLIFSLWLWWSYGFQRENATQSALLFRSHQGLHDINIAST